MASALLSRGRAPTELVEVQLDDPRPDEVLVRIEAVGVCHTDVMTRHRLGDIPAVLGHEGCGVVERVGSDVTRPKVGERVVISFASCGSCDQCIDSQPAYCRQSTLLNGTGGRRDGSPTIRYEGQPVFGAFFGQSSFASHALAPARSCVVVGDVPPEVAAPLGCGFLTGAGAVLNVLRPQCGDRVLVIGGGSVGASATMAALSEAVSTVVAEPHPARRDLARRLGAQAVPSIVEADGLFTHALDTTGRPDVIASSLKLLDHRGVLAIVGLGPAEVTIDARDVMLRGLQLRGCVEGGAVPSELIPELLRRRQAGRFPLEQLVTTRAFADFDAVVGEQVSGKVLKPVLLPPSN